MNVYGAVLERIFLIINDENELDEDVNEWFTRLMALLLNDAPTLFKVFEDKIKYLSLVKKMLEVTLESDKEPLSSCTLESFLESAIAA
jgi:hypothetical protein